MFRGTLFGTHFCRVRVAVEGGSASMAICAEIMNCSDVKSEICNTFAASKFITPT